MITKETLEIINADLDATSGYNPNYKPNNNERQLTTGSPVSDEEKPKSEVKVNVEYTEHLKIYNQIIAYYNFLGLFFGIDVRYDWKMTHHFTFWTTNFILLFANTFVPYNIFGYIGNGDYIRILEPLALCGILFTSDLKWFIFLKNWKVLYSLFFVAKKMCQANLTDGTRAITVTAGLKRTCTIIKAYTIGVIALLLFYVAVPIKFYLVDGILITLMPIKTPFVDESTIKGWLTASSVHAVLGLYSGFATIMFGSGFLIVICNYTFLVDLIAIDWKDLNEMWNGKSKTSVAYRHAFLNNIGKKLQDMKSYMSHVKAMYELKFFIYFIISYLGEVLCLYQIDKNNWIPGYTTACMVFIEMMFYCYVGTQLSIMVIATSNRQFLRDLNDTIKRGDDKMCELVQQTDWYLFDLYSQKVLVMIIHQCQQPNHIPLKSLGSLNMVTGIQIVKGIYSYYTLLTELF